MYLIPGEPLQQPSQRNQWTEWNDLPKKLTLSPHLASFCIKNLVFLNYNNLINVFALFSVRNSTKFSQWYFNKLGSLLFHCFKKRPVKSRCQ